MDRDTRKARQWKDRGKRNEKDKTKQGKAKLVSIT
jgi:hypothetical protein